MIIFVKIILTVEKTFCGLKRQEMNFTKRISYQQSDVMVGVCQSVLYLFVLSLSHIEICFMMWNICDKYVNKEINKESRRAQILFHSTVCM